MSEGEDRQPIQFCLGRLIASVSRSCVVQLASFDQESPMIDYRRILSAFCPFATHAVVGLLCLSTFIGSISVLAHKVQADDATQQEKTDRMKASVKKMKDISLALLTYENKHKHLSPAVVMGPDGKTPHSWRVEMLPYLQRQHEFDNYNMDEPWDSETNLAVAKAAADLFSAPGDEGSGGCSYFLLTGPSTPFDGEKTTTIRKIIDGTTNTVGIVEAKRSFSWTKPEDIAYDASKPLPKLGAFFADGFHVGFLDGSVVFLPKEIDETTLRAMFTHAGRETARRPSIDTWPALVK